MDINGVGPAQGAFPVRLDPSTAGPQAAPQAAGVVSSPQDSVEISSAGRLLDAGLRSPDIRAERLEQIKAEIAAGVYETPEKLEQALSRLLAEVGGDGENRHST